MNKIRLYVASALLLLGLGGAVISPAVALADSPQSVVCSTLGSNGSCSSTPSNGVSLDSTITAVINILSIVVGIVAVIAIIVCGLRMITSNGDSSSFASARTGIIYAIVGLIVVAFAQFIVQFVLNKVTS